MQVTYGNYSLGSGSGQPMLAAFGAPGVMLQRLQQQHSPHIQLPQQHMGGGGGYLVHTSPITSPTQVGHMAGAQGAKRDWAKG